MSYKFLRIQCLISIVANAATMTGITFVCDEEGELSDGSPVADTLVANGAKTNIYNRLIDHNNSYFRNATYMDSTLVYYYTSTPDSGVWNQELAFLPNTISYEDAQWIVENITSTSIEFSTITSFTYVCGTPALVTITFAPSAAPTNNPTLAPTSAPSTSTTITTTTTTVSTITTATLCAKPFRYYNWNINAIRDGYGSPPQAADFYFESSQHTRINNSIETFYQLGVAVPELHDNNTATQWVSSVSVNDGVTADIYIDIGYPRTFYYYAWVTASDYTARDPMSWTLFASHDNISWASISNIVWYSQLTTNRLAAAGSFSIDHCVSFPTAAPLLTTSPTSAPSTRSPSNLPTRHPTPIPSNIPSTTPTASPVSTPTRAPTDAPTKSTNIANNVVVPKLPILHSTDAIPPYKLCRSTYYATCQPPGTRYVAAYTATDFFALDATPNCVLCNPIEDCNADQPASRTTCFPSSRHCTLCGNTNPISVDGASVGIGNVGYTIIVRPECTSNGNCTASRSRRSESSSAATTIFESGYTFYHSSNLIIQGYHTNEPVVVVSCPLFSFISATSVSITHLDVTCLSSFEYSLVAPAILFSGSVELKISAAYLSFSGYVKSGILVLGGNIAYNIIPPTSSTNLAGSTFSTLTFSGASAFLASKHLSLQSFYGTVDVSGLYKYSKCIFQPSVDPVTLVASPVIYNTLNGPRGGLFIVNLSEYINDFGVDWEVDVQDPSEFGYDAEKESVLLQYILSTLSAVAVGGTLLLVFRHQDDLYYLYFLRSMTYSKKKA